jgi:hypothetical protein
MEHPVPTIYKRTPKTQRSKESRCAPRDDPAQSLRWLSLYSFALN